MDADGITQMAVEEDDSKKKKVGRIGEVEKFKLKQEDRQRGVLRQGSQQKQGIAR
jgi:hypothetical protein